MPVRSLAAVAALIGATLAVPAPAAAQPAAAISWGPCAPAEIATVPSEERFRFSCATHVVPLDYDHPDRGSITLALMRRSANDQAHRIGSLFLNPGGPGVSGYRLPTTPTRFLQQRVADRFDLIGFDPRGVARSTPLRCFLTEEDADAVFARLELLIPLTPQEERQTLDALRDYWGFCDRFAGPLLDEMSTKNVALDLDRLRAAVGDVTLNYVGLSYGTMIGAT